MSASNAIGDFDLNNVSLRKPLKFPDGTIQNTAVPTLAEVLTADNDADGRDIVGVNVLSMESAGGFPAQIAQNAFAVTTNNILNTTIIADDNSAGQAFTLQVLDATTSQSIYLNASSANDAQNPITEANDATIIGVIADTGRNLTITNDSTTTSGVRIANTSVLIGAGGNAGTPTVNTTYNATAGQAITTTTAGAIAQANNIGATPTFQVKDTSNGQVTYFVPNSAGGNYNPINTANCQEIIAWGSAGVNTQTLALVPWSGTCCGLRASGGNGSPVNAYLEVGCGGGGADPSQRIRFDNATNSTQMAYTNLTITTGALPNTSGGSATLFLPVTINGVAYKIPLNLA
jgi:hypothetical protein